MADSGRQVDITNSAEQNQNPTPKIESGAPVSDPPSGQVDVSVVIPCLNEANSIAFCIDKAQAAFPACGVQGEVVVADNGSTDGSIAIAREHGARVVHAEARGFGNALRKGIAEARG